ncbi:Type 1 glutamine amidotransferase-like domain-containing protein [Kitasatospora sp. NPDC097643]|uniref:Type 1 glutamine amidotransferase-like domain-containing protein n=1 Tax=Kitasatospora sp. NPDC097643 TaxID=3157230 RepID=UPI003330C798
MAVHLIGGGWDEGARPELYGPFLDEAGPDPAVACLVIDEGDGAEQYERWAGALRTSGRPCRPFPVLVPIGGELDPAALDAADAVLVCGGLTPAYQQALVRPLAAHLTGRPLPYAGFSAGAAIAARRAVVGGWLTGGTPLCPEETGEDLEEWEVRDGLALVDFAVEIHTAQWGTLPRLIEAVATGAVERGVALDENTALTVDGPAPLVRGLGRAHLVLPTGNGGATVHAYRSGERLPL